jgi:hypothetical protein
VRLRSTFISRAGYWPVGCGIAAYLGARFTADIATATWAALAFLAMVYTFGAAMTVRYDKGRVVTRGRRARTVYFSAIGRDGTLRACTFAELIDAAPPEGGTIGWDDPYHVRIHYIAVGGDRGRSV